MSATKSHIKYIGTRPKNDEENPTREHLIQLIKDVGCFFEICTEKLYLVHLAKGENPKTFCLDAQEKKSPFIFWNFRETTLLTYVGFNMDFGPYNLAATHLFCSKVKVWLDTQQFRDPDKIVVIVLGDSNTEIKLNATLLVAIAAMVLLNMTDQEVLQRLNFFMMYKGEPGEQTKQLVFCEKKKFADVTGNQSLMTLTIEDCVKAFYSALQNKFYEYYEFDHVEYLFYETVLSGDLNWIVPGKILAFAGPSESPLEHNKQPPNFYYHYFNDHNVTTIIRLNEPEYESSRFKMLGFDHHDLIFPDGYPPTSSIAAKFIKIVDEAKGAVAVHCYAGIGRTGTLIAAYLMARYDFTPQMAVAWTRICRPGSVIGQQQDWLFTKFDQYSFSKSSSQTPKPLKDRSKIKAASANEVTKINATQTKPRQQQQQAKTSYAVAEKTYGQARALVMTKKLREQTDRPRTRGDIARTLASEGDSSKVSTKRVDVVLDLGKTVPLAMSHEDVLHLKGDTNPKFYHLKDGKYEWKVKFPEPGYVSLKHNYELDLGLLEKFVGPEEKTTIEPCLSFVYEDEAGDDEEAAKIEAAAQTTPGKRRPVKKITWPKLKPIAYYNVVGISPKSLLNSLRDS